MNDGMTLGQPVTRDDNALESRWFNTNARIKARCVGQEMGGLRREWAGSSKCFLPTRCPCLAPEDDGARLPRLFVCLAGHAALVCRGHRRSLGGIRRDGVGNGLAAQVSRHGLLRDLHHVSTASHRARGVS